MTGSNPRPIRMWCTALLALLAGSAATLTAQDNGISIDFAGSPPVTADRVAIPDSVLNLAMKIFNADGTSRYFGGSQLRGEITGSVGIFNAALLISGRVRGDVVVINGDLRLQRGARVDGRIIVLGGRFSPDSGTTWNRPVVAYRASASVSVTSSATLVPTRRSTSLRDLTQRAAIKIGNAWLTPRLSLGVYNRVEGLPVGFGPTINWNEDQSLAVRADGELILRTAKDPSGSRGQTGYWARLQVNRSGDRPLSVGIEISDRVVSTADAVLSSIESSLNSVLFRRDYRDWYNSKGLKLSANWQPTSDLSVGLSVGRARERSVVATSPFSLLRDGNPWRANPLMDDGKFTTIELSSRWSNAQQPGTNSQGWRIDTRIRRSSSGEVIQTLLPEQVRDPLPGSGYQAWEASFDIRRIQRIDPRNAVHLRFAGTGWIGGDPLTIQRRIGLNGADPFPGYAFRTITCDPRNRPDPAAPALCDRRMMIQAEFHRTLNINLGTRVGPYGIGIQQADLILFGDFGSAWVAGDGPGQVPANKIQSMSEWLGDAGIGIDAGWFGTYLAKSLTDDEPLRLSFRLQHRF